jgi:signal transduction histidine kinase
MELGDKYKDNDFLKVVDKYELEDLIEFSKTVKVLYVDNESFLRDDYYGIFKIFFHDIDVASNGQEALELFETNRYDLIITAIDMPIMNGVELISHIRKVSRHITVLVLSSHEKFFVDFIRLGIDGYILNPIEVDQFVTIIQKVIEALQNKQALYEYRIELEQRVQEKTKKLVELNNSLEEQVTKEVTKRIEYEKHANDQSKLAAMGEMLENIAHQWRQPLSVITTAATGMRVQKEMGILEDKDFFKQCANIDNNAQYLSQTIDDFRNFIKGDSKASVFNVKDTINSFSKLISATIKEESIQIHLPTKDEIEMFGYPNELIQCLLNFFNNAKDAFITNHISKKERFIFIDLRLEQSEVIIIFKDNAGGIPPNIIDKVFEPYFTTKHQFQGTGLGLHMSYNLIVHGMKGAISVVNNTFSYNRKKYYGAQFTLNLPLSFRSES